MTRVKMERRALSVWLLLAAAALSVGLWGADYNALPSVEQAAGYKSISARYYLKQVKYLAGDSLKGRGNGTPELDRASEYIAKEFQKSGLSPGGEGGSYFQKFSIIASTELGPRNQCRVTLGPQKSLDLTLNESYRLSSFAGQSDQNQLSGPLVFAGYGITAEEYQYDDYRGIDVTDKIVLILDDEPQENDPKSKFNGIQPTFHSSLSSKAVNAKNHGAKAVLIVKDINNHPADKEEDFSSPQGTTADLGIVIVRIKVAVADSILSLYKTRLSEIQKEIDTALTPKSFPLHGAQAAIEIDARHVRKDVRNVVGYLQADGSPWADEAVVLGAHYDHLGLGGRNSLAPKSVGKIHYGADDNASGTAGLLTLARAIARDKQHLRRSIIFLAFAGEEIGLLGSSYYTKNPRFPLEKTIAMINMDMIGRSRAGKIKIGGVGTSTGFRELAAWASRKVDLIGEPSAGGRGPSDHASFNLKSVPVLFIFSGLHSDYHKPTDVWQKIDAPAAEKVVRMVYLMTRALDGADPRPLYTKVPEEALPVVSSSASGGGGGYGPYFGSIPDMAEEVVGVLFADVRENSPAAKAGLKAADRMIEFDGKKISNLQDFTYALRSKKPGDEVEVVVIRNSQSLKAKVRLEARK
ncbi:MAG: M20/M25/M40 family metallo-hydrolase [Acidobacteria bacterium]|nr:M20/M25/M40 family metallo-hydrolase [Acidobacteriota bacterium]MBI3658407.1 M20/M25/M40 family metallo-hydrolase [Acidobacteriota bacterium]